MAPPAISKTVANRKLNDGRSRSRSNSKTSTRSSRSRTDDRFYKRPQRAAVQDRTLINKIQMLNELKDDDEPSTSKITKNANVSPKTPQKKASYASKLSQKYKKAAMHPQVRSRGKTILIKFYQEDNSSDRQTYETPFRKEELDKSPKKRLKPLYDTAPTPEELYVPSFKYRNVVERSNGCRLVIGDVVGVRDIPNNRNYFYLIRALRVWDNARLDALVSQLLPKIDNEIYFRKFDRKSFILGPPHPDAIDINHMEHICYVDQCPLIHPYAQLVYVPDEPKYIPRYDD